MIRISLKASLERWIANWKSKQTILTWAQSSLQKSERNLQTQSEYFASRSELWPQEETQSPKPRPGTLHFGRTPCRQWAQTENFNSRVWIFCWPPPQRTLGGRRCLEFRFTVMKVWPKFRTPQTLFGKPPLGQGGPVQCLEMCTFVDLGFWVYPFKILKA